MNRSNPSHTWDEDSSSREWSSERGRGGGEGGRGYSSDQVYGQGIPSNQRGGSGREEHRDWNREQQYGRPRGWDDDRWNESSDDEPRWGASGYRDSRQQTQGSRGRQQDFGQGFERHPRFGESRLASSGRDNFGLPDYQGTSHEGQDLARLRAGYRPDEESRRYSSENRFGGGAFQGSYGTGTRPFGSGAYGTNQGAGIYGSGYGSGTGSYGQSAYGSYGSSSQGSGWSGGSSGSHSGRGPKGYSRSDDRIRDDVCERLTYDPDVDASEITVTISQGEVTLAGEVEDRRSKRRAEDIIEDVPGVRDVHNQLRARKGFFGSIVAEVTGKEPEENNVGKGPQTSSSASTSSTQQVKNGGSAFR
jgi:hypothetical protein